MKDRCLDEWMDGWMNGLESGKIINNTEQMNKWMSAMRMVRE